MHASLSLSLSISISLSLMIDAPKQHNDNSSSAIDVCRALQAVDEGFSTQPVPPVLPASSASAM